MIKQIKIKGLDCPNCARALQSELNKIDGVDNVEIDFVKETLTFQCENYDEALQKIIATTKRIEPEAKLEYENHSHKINKQLLIDIIFLILGITVGLICLFVKMHIILKWILFAVSALLLGYKTYYKAIVLLFKGKINENLLLTISVIGAAILGEQMEALMVIALYSIGKIFESLAVNKSRKSIAELTNLRPETARILENGEEKIVDPKTIETSSIIVVKPGEKVAIDGKIISGSANLNLQSLTGESMPTFASAGDEVLSGSIVLDGVLQIKTTKKIEDSAVSKILDLIENASNKKSKTETLISKITKWYTLGVIICSLIVFGIVYLVTKNIDTAVYRGLIFLVVSCPCAFAISVPLSYFSGLGNASKHGILIKGSNYLDACSKLKLIAFDKTGTLTTGRFAVEKIEVFDKKYSEEDIVFLASIGEKNSNHPLAKSIVSFCDKKIPTAKNIKEVSGEGVYYSYKEDKYFVGRKEKELLSTIVCLYKNEKKIGQIYLSDQIKHTSKQTIEELSKMNIETIMLSGDNKESVQKVVKELGLSEGLNNLLPEDKYKWVENQKLNRKCCLGYVGDGINDSPTLALADVGISMGINGSPASIEASDIVLVDDNPAKIPTAIKISKYTQKIVWENISVSALIKFTFLALGSFGVTGMLAAVFADVGVTVLAILNSMRSLVYSPDKNKKQKDLIMEKTFTIEGLSCEHCKMKVENAITKIKGVTAVEVNLETKQIKITTNKEIKDKVFIKTIEKLGYKIII